MRILLVEDEQDIAQALKAGLETAHFAVDIANDGTQGTNLAKLNNYDVIILDYVLPKKTGPEVCTELRSNNIHTPILALSIEKDITAKVDMLDCGADDYLTKPFSFKELLARIHAILRRPPLVVNKKYTVDDIELDPSRHLVTRAGKPLHLTRKEFMILEYLMRNAGTVVTRAMLLEHVWDMNADLLSNTIEVHIRSLRTKLNQHAKKDVIKTISGRGYKIEA